MQIRIGFAFCKLLAVLYLLFLQAQPYDSGIVVAFNGRNCRNRNPEFLVYNQAALECYKIICHLLYLAILLPTSV